MIPTDDELLDRAMAEVTQLQARLEAAEKVVEATRRWHATAPYVPRSVTAALAEYDVEVRR